MKKPGFFLLTLLAFTALFACQQTSQKQETSAKENSQQSTGNFGEEIFTDGSIPAAELVNLFSASDTIEAKLSGHILSSCKHSGCWMNLDLGGQEAVHITFKDEAFTIPLDAAGKNAVIQGTAYRQVVPVETLQNYAREEGKSEEEIAAITEPAWKYEFVATGVIIEE